MTTRRLEIGDWCCTFFFCYDQSDLEEIMQTLQDCDAPEWILEDAYTNITEGTPNEGFTFADAEYKCAVIAMGFAESGAEFLNTFNHELRHLVDDIAYVEGLPFRGEEVAYLTGNITLDVADVVCKYSCNHCRLH